MINHSGNYVSDAAAVTPYLVDPKQLKAALTDVFSRVLRRPHINEDDDFFDLGGDSVLAVSLMAEITEVTGHLLPITALYEASNINSITRLLLDKTRNNPSNLILLKPGQPETPLFMVHGLGGSVMELRELSRHLKIKQMIYGIEARGLEGYAEPFDQVEKMALFHLEQVTRVQPNGPYFFAGYSFGGLVALQMAQILTAAGKQVALLAMIDTYPHFKFWPLGCRLQGLRKLLFLQFTAKFWSRFIKQYASSLSHMPLHEAAPFVFRKARTAARTPFDLFKLGALMHRFMDTDEIENLSPVPQGNILPAHLQKVIAASDQAFAAYRPRFYPGKITFFKAETAIRVPFDAKSLWGKMCGTIAVYPIPGNHRNLITHSARFLAEMLGTCVIHEFHHIERDNSLTG